ncbi:uncharacterized protein [Triticum aestivum]|uniref:uncharacterized protein n=1 Tax=Triticum aestivum TaxID=4565 RepID=UPI001D0166E6|nr:uncharacterized protein LOC123129667 [Triticum aestivum]
MSTAKPLPRNQSRRPRLHSPARPAAASDAAAAKPAMQLRKLVFTTIDRLQLETHGHTLTACVLSARIVLDKPSRQTRVAECLVSDPTDTVLFTARNNQSAGQGLMQLRKAVNRLYENKAQLNSISMHLGKIRSATDLILRDLQNNPDMWLQVVHILLNSQNLNTEFFSLQDQETTKVKM